MTTTFEVSPQAQRPRDHTRWLRRIGSVVAPTAALTAVLYYFGWLRTNAAADEAGLDPSLFGYGTSDYILRSTQALVRPVGLCLALGAVAIVADSGIVRAITRRVHSHPGSTRILVGTAGLVGLAALALGVYRLPGYLVEAPAYLTPIMITGGSLLLVFAVLLPLRTGDEWFFSDSSGRIAAVFLGVLAVAGLLLATARYAEYEGRGSINGFVARIADGTEPTVTLTSPVELDLPGGHRETLTVDGVVLYRYRCLHLLVRTDDRYFLVNNLFGLTSRANSETTTSAIAMLVHDTESLRVDFDSSSRRGGRDACRPDLHDALTS